MPTDPAPAGSARPEPRPVVAVDSWARRAGDAVRVVVVLADDLGDLVGGALTSRRVWVRAARRVDGERVVVRGLAEVTPGDRPRLVAELPTADLHEGTWNLALRVGRDGPVVPLEARLLVTDPARQPLALLAGPRPQTLMAPPVPRT